MVNSSLVLLIAYFRSLYLLLKCCFREWAVLFLGLIRLTAFWKRHLAIWKCRVFLVGLASKYSSYRVYAWLR